MVTVAMVQNTMLEMSNGKIQNTLGDCDGCYVQ